MIDEKGKLIIISLMLLLVLTSLKVQAIDVNNCDNLSVAGDYVLTGDITNSITSNCINISSDNVTFDCQGYTIDGDNTADYGIYVWRSSATETNVTIRNCNITEWDTSGIRLFNAEYTNLTNLTVGDNENGIWFTYSDYTIIDDCIVHSNAQQGLYFSYDNYVTIKNSVFRDSGFFDIDFDNDGYDCDNTFINVNGTGDKPIIYFNDSVTLENYDNNVSEIILCDADNSHFNNITLTGNDNNGIVLVATEDSTFSNINITDLYNGFLFVLSDSNILSNITSNSNTIGVYLLASKNITFKNFTSKLDAVGISIPDSDNATIINSLFHSNTLYGVFVSSTSFLNISDSMFINNPIGLQIVSSSENLFYNNFFNNTININFVGTIYNNFWNTTKQLGENIFNSSNPYISGNYWTNSSGDGYSDTCTDADTDGFCDSPYNISTNSSCVAGLTCNENSTDYLPLSNEYVVVGVVGVPSICSPLTRTFLNLVPGFFALAILGIALIPILVLVYRKEEINVKLLLLVFIGIIIGVGFIQVIAENITSVCG